MSDLFTQFLSIGSLHSQHARLLRVETALDSQLPDALLVEHFTGTEAVNAPFQFEVTCLSLSAEVDLKQFIGEEITLKLLQADDSLRAWHGYCTQATWLGADGGMARYLLRLEPFTAFLALRMDAYIFQDKTAEGILTELLADYPQANFDWQVTQPLKTYPIRTQYRETDWQFITRLLADEGLSYRFEHQQTHDGQSQYLQTQDSQHQDSQQSSSNQRHAKHKLVVFDATAPLPEMPLASTIRFHGVRATEASDSIQTFSASRQVQPNAVSISSWHPEHVMAFAAETSSALEQGNVPFLPIYQGAHERRFANTDEAEVLSTLQLQALEMHNKTFHGRSAVRHLAAGYQFNLTHHEHYTEGSNRFTVLSVTHHATNNLDAGMADMHADLDASSLTTEMERGTYRNTFTCIRHTVAIVPEATAHRRPATAMGPQIAFVVGVPEAPITTERNHRVKIQFPWQRGHRPLAGGLTDLGVDGHGAVSGAKHAGDTANGNAADSPSGNAALGNAPSNETSGTWVRVAEALAGPNWGTQFIPRIGAEVLVDFIEGDIDKPVIVAQLYNGVDTPPFASGVDSGINHNGYLSGIHSHSLDKSGYNQWVIDDAPKQLRMRLATSFANTQLNMGYLIQQSPYNAQRGAYRGTGFELNTQAWSVIRGAEGVLITTRVRPQHGASVTSTQMDVAEAVAQLHQASQLTQQLSESATHQQALVSQAANAALQQRITELDPKQQGKYTDPINGQAPYKPKPNSRELDTQQPVEKFATPSILLDSASSQHWASPATSLIFAGQHLHWTTQQDTHWAAGHTYASVSGRATTYYTHSGGIQAIAANGPVSVQAHTDQLEILADQEVVITSSDGHILIQAQKSITLQAGQSSIELNEGNITFTCPGLFSMKSAMNGRSKGARGEAILKPLPSGQQRQQSIVEKMDTFRAKFLVRGREDERPISQMLYRTMLDGVSTVGLTDENGETHLEITKEVELMHMELMQDEKFSRVKIDEGYVNQWFNGDVE